MIPERAPDLSHYAAELRFVNLAYHPLGEERYEDRRQFEQRFSATRMAKDYLQVYRSLLERTSTVEQVPDIAPLQPVLEGMN